MKASVVLYYLEQFINEFGDPVISFNYDKNKTLSITIHRKCKDCNTTYEIPKNERDYFIKKKWNLPVRCKQCREIRKWKNEMYEGLRGTMNNNDKMRSRTKPRSNATKNFNGYRM